MKVIAEISGNHCNDEFVLEKLVCESIESGADIIKMQLFEARNLVPEVPSADFPIYDSGIWKGRGGFDVLSETETHPRLIEIARDICSIKNVELMISIFDPSDLTRIPTGWKGPIKVASLEADYSRLIAAIRNLDNDLFISTGAFDPEERRQLIDLYPKGSTFFYCQTVYPCPEWKYRVDEMIEFKSNLVSAGMTFGVSDHTTSLSISNLFQIIGAEYIEKHVKLDHETTTPDSKFSITPSELKVYVENARGTHQLPTSFKTRKCVYGRAMSKGEKISAGDLKFFRCQRGIASGMEGTVLGKVLVRDVDCNTLVSWEDLDVLGS